MVEDHLLHALAQKLTQLLLMRDVGICVIGKLRRSSPLGLWRHRGMDATVGRVDRNSKRKNEDN